MLYIRTDMNNIIATGHMMRCLAIADAAKEDGEETLFIVSDRQAVDLLEQRGYSYFVLGTKWNDMESELPVLEKLIYENRIKKILVDSYQVTYAYLKKVKNLTETFYIDDINAFFYPVNAIICCANFWKKFNYPSRYKETALYLGPQYVPLRKEFCNCGKKEINPIVKNLLIMSGGSDPYDILSKILEKLELKSYKNIDVICGMYNMKYDDLNTRFFSFENVHIHKSVENISDFMRKADLAVSAGGTTLYELCAVGTPAISYSLADNQLDNVEKFQEDGIIDYAGDVRKDDVGQNVVQFIQKYQKDENLRMEKSKKMQTIVDGNGAKRISEILKTEKGNIKR